MRSLELSDPATGETRALAAPNNGYCARMGSDGPPVVECSKVEVDSGTAAWLRAAAELGALLTAYLPDGACLPRMRIVYLRTTQDSTCTEVYEHKTATQSTLTAGNLRKGPAVVSITLVAIRTVALAARTDAPAQAQEDGA
jgi:hypothetical protein